MLNGILRTIYALLCSGSGGLLNCSLHPKIHCFGMCLYGANEILIGFGITYPFGTTCIFGSGESALVSCAVDFAID